MPRKRRFAPIDYPHHVINRGNDRRVIFRDAADYERFLGLLIQGKERYRVLVFGLCLMPNHFHALIQPFEEGALSAYLQWVLGCYACDLRAKTGTIGYGHVFQRRFWNAGIKDTRHFLTVLRYIEANPSRAGLVSAAEFWPWSSLALRDSVKGAALLDPLPLDLPGQWTSIVNTPQATTEIKTLRRPLRRGRPADTISLDPPTLR